MMLRWHSLERHGLERYRTALSAHAALCAVLLSCAHQPNAYDQALSRAREVERRGETTAAADAYRAAARLATSEDAQAEALYREAQVWRRIKDDTRAARLLDVLAQEHPHAARTPRALLDLGRLLEKQGKSDDAKSVYLKVVRRYPTSAVAESAAQGFARLCSPPASVTYHHLLAGQPPGRLDEFLRMRYGASLAEEGRPREAIAVLEELASRYPLPESTIADDALLRSAQLRRELGDPEGSLHILQVLLADDVRADLLGSYIRGTRAQGRWLQAEIWRDELANDERALASFLTLTREQPESLLADDALWQAAFLAKKMENQSKACALQQAIRERVPPSRYAACSGLICGSPPAAPLTVGCMAALDRLPQRLRPAAYARPPAGSTAP